MMKMQDWQTIVTMLMEDMNHIDVPHELTYKGQFNELVERIAMAGSKHSRQKRSHWASRSPTRTRD